MSAPCSFFRHGGRHRHVHRYIPFIAPQNDNDNGTDETSPRQLAIAAHRRTTRRSFDDSVDLQQRSYHTTPPRPFLPLLAAGIVGLTAAYGYRALRQMDAEWEDYYERLEEFEAASRGAASRRVASHFTGGTLALDLGTSGLKVGHCRRWESSSGVGGVRPEIVVDREGFRSIPALVWMASRDANHSDTQQEEAFLVGRMAAARKYDCKGGRVFSTRDALQYDLHDEVLDRGVRQAIRMAASNALEQVVGGGSKQASSLSGEPLFVLDESMASQGVYNVRPVFTYPPSCSVPGSSNNYNHNHALLQRYMNVVQHFVSPKDIALFVPEPVAALTGAEHYNLLPRSSSPSSSSASDDKTPVAVVDVGGSTTHISIVSSEQQHYSVMYSTSMPWGGDTFVDLLIRHLIQCFYGQDYDAINNNNNNNNSIKVPSTQPTLNDPIALQRLYDASATALQELSRKTRCQINIPYLSIDMQTRQPKHLEVDVARSILDAEVESFLRDELVSYLLQNSNQSASTVLSNSLPPPTDLSTLFASALAAAMEKSSHTPQSLRAILLVGGGSRIPLVRQAIQRGVANLGGDMFLERLVMPEGEMGVELTVLGAALCGGGGARM